MSSRIRTRLLATAAAAIVAGAVVGVVPADAATSPAPSPRWGACPTGAPAPQQCATLRVPLSYGDPTGRAIDIEISRIPAARPEQRKGVLMLNGGGPGPSLDMPTLLGGLLPARVRDSYDLVAFDPRGIAYSTPITCGRTVAEMVRDEQLEVLSFPAADGSIDDNVAYARRMARQCAAHSGDLLPHLSTANIARDMDQIRRALGERTISYYGISWGTYLGAVYRALFPRAVDRMAIDSAVDPDKHGYEDFRTFDSAMEDRWPDLARFAVTRQSTVGLGGTPREVRRNYLALAAKLDRRPVTLPGTQAPINGNLVRLFTWQLSYNDAGLPTLGRLWQAANHLAAGTATAADREFLEELTTSFVAKAVMPGVPQDNLLSAGWAISCGDQAWPREVGVYARNTAASRAAFPLTAGAPANIAPCSAWATRPSAPGPRVTPTGKRNVLILQNRRDPSTPLSSARAMRRAMGTDAVLVDVDAGGHGVLVHPEPSACAIGSLADFLTAGTLPAKDTSCP